MIYRNELTWGVYNGGAKQTIWFKMLCKNFASINQISTSLLNHCASNRKDEIVILILSYSQEWAINENIQIQFKDMTALLNNLLIGIKPSNN